MTQKKEKMKPRAAPGFEQTHEQHLCGPEQLSQAVEQSDFTLNARLNQTHPQWDCSSILDSGKP